MVTIPAGFRVDPNGIGLIVPEVHSRAREVLTKDETKTLSRMIQKVLSPKGIRILLMCEHENCPDRKIVRVREGGHALLRCGHRDLVLEDKF